MKYIIKYKQAHSKVVKTQCWYGTKNPIVYSNLSLAELAGQFYTELGWKWEAIEYNGQVLPVA